MNQHTLIRTGAGLGLLAASCATMADISSFGRPMAFMRIESGKTSYAAFMPWFTAGAVGGPVIYLDLGQSGTQSTWAFGVAYAASSNSNSWAGSSGGWPVANSMTYWNEILNTTATQTGTFSFLGGDTYSKRLDGFNYSTVVSSVSCNVSLDAYIGSDGYLLWTGIMAEPSRWSTWTSSVAPLLSGANSFVLFPTSTSGSIYLLASSNRSQYLSAITADRSMPTVTRVFTSSTTQSTWATSNSTLSSIAVPSGIPKAYNACLAAWQGRNAQNQPSAALGGKSGFMRIW